MTPRTHETPPEAVLETTRELVRVGERTFTIHRPLNGDELFDHPAVRAAYAADDYIPYWAELWPAARMLAKTVLARPPEPAGSEALEVACGLGLSGIAALARGFRVTFSDIDATATAFAARNARANGFTDFATCALDVRAAPPRQFPLILGADLLYEPRLIAPVAGFLAAALTPEGVALISDPDRLSARSFRHELRQVGLTAEAMAVRVGMPGGGRVSGTVYQVSRG